MQSLLQYEKKVENLEKSRLFCQGLSGAKILFPRFRTMKLTLLASTYKVLTFVIIFSPFHLAHISQIYSLPLLQL